MEFLTLSMLVLTFTAFVAAANDDLHHAKAGQFPYQVFLRIKRFMLPFNRECTGAMISETWILTTAHCVRYLSTAHLFYATVNINSPIKLEFSTVGNVYVHPNFTEIGEYDIALLRTPKVKYAQHIQPAILPSLQCKYPDYLGKNVIVSGWRHRTKNVLYKPHLLKWSNLVVLNKSDCDAYYSKGLYPTFCLKARPQEEIVPCRGDIGAPMVLESSKMLIGLVSNGKTKCEAGVPIVASRIFDYLLWIKDITGIPIKDERTAACGGLAGSEGGGGGGGGESEGASGEGGGGGGTGGGGEGGGAGGGGGEGGGLGEGGGEANSQGNSSSGCGCCCGGCLQVDTENVAVNVKVNEVPISAYSLFINNKQIN